MAFLSVKDEDEIYRRICLELVIGPGQVLTITGGKFTEYGTYLDPRITVRENSPIEPDPDRRWWQIWKRKHRWVPGRVEVFNTHINKAPRGSESNIV